MAFENVRATGSGAIAARLVIEGLAVQFVTDEAMERTLDDGRERIACLPIMGKGIVIEESVNLPEALLEARGASIQVQEVEGEHIAEVLAYNPDRQWFISATIGESDTTVSLLSTLGITAGDVIHVGTEAMRVESVGGTSVTVERAVWNTIAQAHQSNTTTIPYRSATNRPLTIRGRRAYLHLYDEGDDPQGDGEQVWIGHVNSTPRCTDAGCMWSFQLASIAERLRAKVGGELDVPLHARGIYYSWAAPLRITIGERVSGDWAPARGGAFVGHFESTTAFCDALTAWLAGLGLTSVCRAVPAAPFRSGLRDAWTIECVVGASVTDVSISIASEQDGRTNDRPDFMLDADGMRVLGTTLAAGQRIYPFWHSFPVGYGTEPRGFYGRSTSVEHSATGAADYPETRFYLAGPVSSDWTGVTVEWADGSAVLSIRDSSTADNWIDVVSDVPREATLPPLAFLYNQDQPVVIRPTRTFVTRGNLADFRDALVAEGPANCNRGTAPFLTANDLADWRPVVNQAARRAWQRIRTFSYAQAVDLEELLAHEMRALAMFPVINPDGRIGVRLLDLPSASASVTTILDDEIISAGWSTVERGGQTINRIVVKTGYDPIEDDWAGTAYEIQDMTSYAQDHTDRPLEITQRSIGIMASHEDYAEAAIPVLSLFGYPHDFVTMNVSWKHFGLRLGDAVRLSAHHLPDFTQGRRPMHEMLGIVVSRRWPLGEAHGELRILVPGISPAGYSPTARILSQSDSGGDKWALTVDPAMYAPAGRTVPELFAVGDVVRIIQYDSASPTVRDGEVIAVNVGTSQIAVQLTASWTPGASTWELCYGPWGSVTDSQKRYAFIASADATLDGASPKTWAP